MGIHPHFLWADLFQKKQSQRATLKETLRQNILFRTLSNRELNYLATIVYERTYRPSESIFNQGDKGFGMYVISEGTVTIKTRTDTGEVLMTTLKAGNFFGELSLINEDNRRSATATAEESSVLVGFFKPDLNEILERKPAMGVKILLQLAHVLGTRLLKTNERFAQIVEQDKRGNEDAA